jgi:hypothetical protein
MQTNLNQTRADAEAAIEGMKDNIYECKHKLRWFIRGVFVFCSGVFIAIVSFIIVNVVTPFNIPVLNSILEPVGVGAVVISILIGIGLVYSYSENIRVRDWLKELGEDRQVLKRLVHGLHISTNRPFVI